jgi:hypothetical protein
MSGNLIVSEANWLEVRQSTGVVLQPFQQEVFLAETHVAGTLHVDDVVCKCRGLKAGDELRLVREPENRIDGNAIRVETSEGAKIGYVPRKDNPVFARLMDAGKCLFARLRKKELLRHYLDLEVEIFLRDV